MNSDLRQGFYLDNLLVEPNQKRIIGPAGATHLNKNSMEVLLCLSENAGRPVSSGLLLKCLQSAGDATGKDLDGAIAELRAALDDPEEESIYLEALPDQAYRIQVQPSLPGSGPGSTGDSGMGTGPPGEPGLFENLKQRGVFETAIAYLVVGWLIVQVVDVLFDQLHLPAWAGTFVTVGVIAGFPIAIVLSWFLELRGGRAVLDDRPAVGGGNRKLSRTYISVIAALLIATVGVYIYDRNVGLPEPASEFAQQTEEKVVLPPILENSIAVLPFFNMDGSPETQIFAQGLVDDVITRLSRVPGLLVSSRGDAFTLEPNSASQKVRERLRVALYLEGSVQIQEDRLRIIVQLIDSETGFHVLSRRFDRLREDFFNIRDEITELTVANVRVALPPDTQAASNIAGQDPSLDVYVLYRRGMDMLHLPDSETTLQSAVEWFDQALAIDPEYAAAHAGKCTAFVEAYPVSDNPAYIGRAESSCAQALALNPNLDVVHTALGDLYSATGKYTEAKSAYLAALDINPNSVKTLSGLASIYMLQGKMDEAEEHFRLAVGLHPGDWSAYSALGYFLYRSGRYAEAAEQYEIVVALDNTNMTGFTNLGAAYMLAGDFSAATPAFEKAIEIEAEKSTYSNLGLMHYYLGRFEESINAHGQAIKLAPSDHLAWSNLGDALWIAGRQAQAKDAFSTAEKLANDALGVNPNDPYTLMDLAWITTMLDQRKEAYKLLERARSLAPDDPYLHYYEGLMRLRSGEWDAALSSFALSVEKGYPVQMLAADPQLEPVQGRPELEKIIRQAESR